MLRRDDRLPIQYRPRRERLRTQFNTSETVMKIAITGVTGFLGRYLVGYLREQGHGGNLWYRPTSDREGVVNEPHDFQWVPGDLDDPASMRRLVDGCDAVVHAALDHPGGGFRGGEGDPIGFLQRNVMGTAQLIETARQAEVARFIFISTCAVHERILDDRPLDETHPLWPTSLYGAHKAAIEKLVHAYGYGQEYAICAVRPTGVYGIASPPHRSKWYDLIRSIVRGDAVVCQQGGKEVHASDVARAVGILLTADRIGGEVYNCCDRYISEFEVASMARQICGSRSAIEGQSPQPRHQIVTTKLRKLGMEFGGETRLLETVGGLVDHVRQLADHES